VLRPGQKRRRPDGIDQPTQQGPPQVDLPLSFWTIDYQDGIRPRRPKRRDQPRAGTPRQFSSRPENAQYLLQREKTPAPISRGSSGRGRAQHRGAALIGTLFPYSRPTTPSRLFEITNVNHASGLTSWHGDRVPIRLPHCAGNHPGADLPVVGTTRLINACRSIWRHCPRRWLLPRPGKAVHGSGSTPSVSHGPKVFGAHWDNPASTVPG